uniref:C2H2-type domain-containing protein n=1 Tax=Heliothis virescens TaxID=7102 RepID=A0A2A4K5P5_HELVI
MRDCEILKNHTSKHSEDLATFISQRIISKDIPVKIDVSNIGCKECEKPLKDLEELISHIITVHEGDYEESLGVCALPFVLTKNLMQCVLCENQYDNFTSMVSHMHKDHISHSSVCQICGLSFISKIRLKRHINNSHIGYRCTICSKMFNASHRMEKHKQKMHGQGKNFECNLCSAGFERERKGGQDTTAPPESLDTDHQTTTLQSSSKPTLTAKDKRNIMRNNVVQVLTKSTVMPFRWLKSSYRCFYCYDIFQEASELKNHQQTHTGDAIKIQAMKNYWEPVVYIDISELSCNLCPDKITDLYDLVDHLILIHGVEYNKDVGICMVAFKLDNFNISCLACGVSFYTFGPLLHHTNKDHKGTSAILCDVCGQHFKDANLLRLHVKTVHENVFYACTECGDKFDSKSKLKTHQKNNHDMEKKYKCANCSEVFQSHYKRSRHMAAEHKNKQEIKCPHCPKTFVFRSMMMTHLRDSHLKFRNHVCGVCGWKAFNSNRLKNHMYKHSGEKNFKCDVCEKAFTTKKIMKAHFARMHKTPHTAIMQYDNPYVGQV